MSTLRPPSPQHHSVISMSPSFDSFDDRQTTATDSWIGDWVRLIPVMVKIPSPPPPPSFFKIPLSVASASTDVQWDWHAFFFRNKPQERPHGRQLICLKLSHTFYWSTDMTQNNFTTLSGKPAFSKEIEKTIFAFFPFLSFPWDNWPYTR